MIAMMLWVKRVLHRPWPRSKPYAVAKLKAPKTKSTCQLQSIGYRSVIRATRRMLLSILSLGVGRAKLWSEAIVVVDWY